MKTFLLNNNSDELILFFCGWGMDEKPLLPIETEKDVLFVYNYSELNLDFNFSKYKKIFLFAYSCGVFMAGYLKEALPKIDCAIAINGTFKLFDENLGLKNETVKVFEKISLSNYMDFRQNYLVETKKELETFNKNQPHRTVEDSLFELQKLKEYYQNAQNVCFEFNKIFVSKNDKVIPVENQTRFWKKYKFINGGHFPFYNLKTFDKF